MKPTRDAQDVGLRWVHGRDAEGEAIAAFDREAGRFDEPVGLAREVAAAGQVRPDGGVGSPLKRPQRGARRGDMLEEAQLSAGPQDAVNLRERCGHVGDRAEHERRDGGVERRGGERQFLGDGIHDRHRHGRIARGALRELAQMPLGLDGDHLGDGRRVVREVAPVPGAHLEHLPGEPVEQPATSLSQSEPLGLAALAHVQASAQGVVDPGRHVRTSWRSGA
jgi:hypothetical protein